MPREAMPRHGMRPADVCRRCPQPRGGSMNRHALNRAVPLGSLIAVVLMLAACAPTTPTSGGAGSRFGRTPAERSGRFVAKSCLDSGCHANKRQEFAKKVVHAPVKQEKCETCHQRHGLVGALILAKQGSELCYACHPTQKAEFQRLKQHAA